MALASQAPPARHPIRQTPPYQYLLLQTVRASSSPLTPSTRPINSHSLSQFQAQQHSSMAALTLSPHLPQPLTASSDPPPIFDGTTRLYIAYICPFAQRTWIARNYKGLQDKIELVPIDLQDRPVWYKEKVYPENKVPSLEHNNKVKGESLDLLKYIDENFEGPALLPNDPAKQKFAEELLSYTDHFTRIMYPVLMSKADLGDEIYSAFDKLEEALSKFDDGPFFLGQFSLVDIAYAPFIERFQTLFLDVKSFDITKGRPKLATWIEELNKLDSYSQTKLDPQELLAHSKKRLGIA